jgi:DNA topoisomerase-3
MHAGPQDEPIAPARGRARPGTAPPTARRPGRRPRSGGPAATATPPRSRRPIAALPPLTCPRCKQAPLIAGRRGWGCARWREGCAFVVWFETAGRTLTPALLRELVTRGKTRRATFTPTGGPPVEGRLVLDPSSPEGARFIPS